MPLQPAHPTPFPNYPHPDAERGPDSFFRHIEIVNGPEQMYPAFRDRSQPLKFGGDGYTNEPDVRRHVNNFWAWLDFPHFPLDSNPPGDQSLKQQNWFISWVTGNLGSCWCMFGIEHQWDRNNGRQSSRPGAPVPNVVRGLRGGHCNILQP
jgi:hypothetical protein